MNARLIDMTGEAGTFRNVTLEGFEGVGRVEFIGQCADMGSNGEFRATATDEPANMVQVRGISGEITPWVILRKNDVFYFPNHRKLEIRYQAKQDGKIYLITGPIGDLAFSGKGHSNV